MSCLKNLKRTISFALLALGLIQLPALTYSLAAPPIQGRLDPSLVLPELRTDREIVQFLLWAKEHVPTLFTQAATYDIDLFDLTAEQTKLIEVLKSNPEFMNAVNTANSNLLSIEILPRTEVTASVRKIDSTKIEPIRTLLLEAANSLPDGQSQSSLVSAYRTEAQALGARNSGNLVTGLVLALPKEVRGKIFQADTEERLAYLAQNLPDPLPPQFNAQTHGFRTTPGRDEVLQAVRRLMNQEQRLTSLAILYGMQGNQPTSSSNKATLIEKVRSASSDQLAFLTDKSELAARLQGLEAPAKTEPLTRANQEVLLGRINQQVRASLVQEEQTVIRLGKPIMIREVPPTLGIFRGCAGGDCATQLAFPYPNDPNEKVYFIYDEKGGIKGYVEGTVMKAGAERSFYLNTLTGWRVSSEDARMILHAFDREKARLGVTQIVLPSEVMMDQLINYMPVREVFREATAGKAEVSLTYLNPEVRSLIENFVSENNEGHYDQMELHKKALVFGGGDSKNAPKIEIRTGTAFYPGFQDRSLEKKALLELALDIKYSQGIGAARPVLSVGQIPENEFAELTAVLSNRTGAPIAQFESSAAAKLAAVGMDPALLDEKRYLRHAGRFKASDALSDLQRERTMKDLLEELKINIESRSAADFIRRNAAEVAHDQTFLKGFIPFFKDGINSDQLVGLFRVLDSLPSVPEEFAPLILPHAMDDYDEIAQAAQRTLAKMNPQSKDFHTALEELTRSKTPAVKARALRLADKLKVLPANSPCAPKFRALPLDR